MLERVQFVTASSPRDLSDSENLPYCWVESFSARGRVKRFSNDNNPRYIPLLNITKKKKIKKDQFNFSIHRITFFSANNFTLRPTYNFGKRLHFDSFSTSSSHPSLRISPQISTVRTSNICSVACYPQKFLAQFCPSINASTRRETERETNCARGNAPPRLVTRRTRLVISAAIYQYRYLEYRPTWLHPAAAFNEGKAITFHLISRVAWLHQFITNTTMDSGYSARPLMLAGLISAAFPFLCPRESRALNGRGAQ